MYRYKAPHDGCTRHSVKGLKYIDKIGKLISIEAYTVGAIMNGVGDSKWVDNKIRIVVRGENGTCTYGGFLWGYGGEGPHGLRDLFLKCGMSRTLADHYAFNNALGDNDIPLYGTKLYNATTLWKFQNSDVGFNLIKNQKNVSKFKKGQQLMCNYSFGKEPYKCIFINFIKNTDKALVEFNMPLINLNNIKLIVPVNSLTP